MSKSIEKIQAIKLRREGKSIKDIAKILSVSPGSVSLWCQSIVLTEQQQEILYKKQISAGHYGRQIGADMNREKRLHQISEAQSLANKEVLSVSGRELFFLGLGIYWGEGVKSRSGQAAVVNSDSRILKVMIKWFCECMLVDKMDFRPYVYISTLHREREEIIMQHWARVLQLPLSQFKSPIYLDGKVKQKYENHDTYFGVVSLRVRKSTNLKYRILSLLQIVANRLE